MSKMSCQTFGATPITNGVTTVDCQKQVRSWRLLRYLIALLIPTCNSSIEEEEEDEEDEEEEEETKQTKNPHHYYSYIHTHQSHKKRPSFSSYSTNKITGTIFGFRRGKVSLCVQTTFNSTNPILLLELAVPTTVLAKEMKGGILRIALESTSHDNGYVNSNNSLLLSTPLWTMYCNGRKVGYAIKRRPSEGDMKALRLMEEVVVGAGVISGKEFKREEDELMYLRANFERICGSVDAESFHLIDPDGSIGQELSIFFFR